MFDGSVTSGNIWRKIEVGPWEKFFAYRPVRVHGKLVWLRTVYRRATWHYGGDNGRYCTWKYGNIFDIVKQ